MSTKSGKIVHDRACVLMGASFSPEIRCTGRLSHISHTCSRVCESEREINQSISKQKKMGEGGGRGLYRWMDGWMGGKVTGR